MNMILPLELREADATNLDEMMVVMDEAFDPAFGEAWNSAQCLGILGLPGVWLTIARRGPEPIGFALSRIVFDEAELLLLGVRPAFRHQGVGQALLDHMMETAGTLGASRVHLEVREGNDALRLYEAASFSQIGRRRGYYRGRDGQLFDALTLASSLIRR
jgi:ribosomal-protein-alanine N-acetyltransferase